MNKPRHTKKIRKHKRKYTRRYSMRHKPNLKSMPKPKIYIQNYGETTTLINNNDDKSKRQLKWVGDYNGDNLSLKIDVIKDNDRKMYNINMNNDELKNLLNIPPVNTSLSDRLTNDFLGNDNYLDTNKNYKNEIVKEDVPVFLDNEELLFMDPKKDKY